MLGNSLQELLEWMDGESIMSGWDVIVALGGAQVNQALRDEHRIRLSRNSVMGPFNGVVPMPEVPELQHHVYNYRFSAPELSFANASLNSNTLALSMRVMSGAQLFVRDTGSSITALKLVVHTPLDGPRLLMGLTPDSTPGNAEAGAQVVLDMAKGEDLLLEFSRTPAEQREGGKLFKALFSELDDDRRIYPLSTFAPQSNSFLNARQIDLRTQSSGNAASSGLAREALATDENGAVVYFVSLEEGGSGTFPSDNSGFKYLIPNDPGKDYSGTALFSRQSIVRSGFGESVQTLLDTPQFQYVKNASGALQSMVATAGVLQVPKGSWKTDQYAFENGQFTVSAAEGASPLTVQFGEPWSVQYWKPRCTLEFRYKPADANDYGINYTATFDLSLKHDVRLGVDETGQSVLGGELWTCFPDDPEVTAVSGIPANLPITERAQINSFVSYIVKAALLNGFANTLVFDAPETFLANHKHTSGDVLLPSEQALPHDYAAFGKVTSATSALRISNQQPFVSAGKEFQFAVEPARSGIVWTLESLEGYSGSPGTITNEGNYRAPPAYTIDNEFIQLLVIAKDTATQESSVALVTVLTQAISANPLIQVCYPNDRVELTAAALDGSSLTWVIKDPVSGKSGKLEPGTVEGECTYIAAPLLSDTFVVLDKIEVSSASAGARTVYVLVIHFDPRLEIRIDNDAGLPDGEIQLQATARNAVVEAEWSVLAGSGVVSRDEGVYTPGPSSEEPFVLITAAYEIPGLGLAEGYLILPLPLSDFQGAINTFSR